jgi:hypothetical protein
MPGRELTAARIAPVGTFDGIGRAGHRPKNFVTFKSNSPNTNDRAEHHSALLDLRQEGFPYARQFDPLLIPGYDRPDS